MTFANLLRLVTKDVNEIDAKSYARVSDAIYYAITEAQKDSECSQYRVQQVVGSGTVNELIIFPEFHGSDYAISSSRKFNIEILRVEAAWKVESNGSYTPIWLSDKFNIQFYKDAQSITVNDTSLYGSVSFDTKSVKLYTAYNMASTTIEFWVRFQNPYIEDVMYSTTVDVRASFLETVPERFHANLVSGCKYHLYKAMEENDRFQGKFKAQMEVYFRQWYQQDLKSIISLAAIPIPKKHNLEIRPPGVFIE